MFHEMADDPGSQRPAALEAAYDAALRDVLDDHGVEAVAAEAGVAAATLEALSDGNSPDLTLEEAAAVLAVAPETPDADTIEATSRDALLMGMTPAVLAVAAVESGLDGELEAREIQSKVEGRFPMTLSEFALLQQYIESKT